MKVRVLLDKSQRTDRYSSATFLHNAGVPVWIDDQEHVALVDVVMLFAQRAGGVQRVVDDQS